LLLGGDEAGVEGGDDGTLVDGVEIGGCGGSIFFCIGVEENDVWMNAKCFW